MKFSFTTVLPILLLPFSLAAPAVISNNSGQAIIHFDTRYDNLNAPINDLACSDGEHGLITKGYPTLGSLLQKGKPDVDVGAKFGISWNSGECGKCYSIMYQLRSIYIIAVDTAGSGSFNLSKRAFNKLTNGRAEELGGASVTWNLVDPKFCGL